MFRFYETGGDKIYRENLHRQIANNRSTRNCHRFYSGHRGQVMGHILAERGPACAKLCIVGAGNCNDSNQTCPQIPGTTSDAIEDIALQAIEQHNFFTGTNPFAIIKLFETDQFLSQSCKAVSLSKPWKWRLSPDEWRLVYALIFVARGA